MARIFASGIGQESNSFNPLKSSFEDFILTEGAAFRETPGLKTLINAGFEVVESIWARAVPGGTLRFNDFMKLVDLMLEPLISDTRGFDGVFLLLHGALDVEHIGSGEAYLVARIREYVGPNVPISAALDMHANNMYTLASSCNIMYGYRKAPHTDVRETHIKAAELLWRAIDEKVLPHTQILRIPLLMPGENFMTSSGLGKEVIEQLPTIETDKNVWCASYFVGMTWVDCPQNGATLLISGLGDMGVGMKKAEAIAKFVWSKRDEFKYQGFALQPDDGVNFAKKHQGNGLVILSDSADNITAGGAGDNAFVLSLFIEKKIKNALFCCIVDPIAVNKYSEYDIGTILDVELGAAFDENSTKVRLTGATLKAKNLNPNEEKPKSLIESKPRSIVISYQGIDILLFDKRKPVFSEITLQEHGLTRHNYEIMIVKQGYLEPEFNEAAVHQAMLYTHGNVDQKVERLPFKKLRRPMYPLDPADDIPKNRLFEMSY